MKPARTRIHRDERGATLIFAVAFLVIISGITAATLSFVTSGVNDRGILDGVRNRQYAADAAVEYEIAQTRQLAAPGSAIAPPSCVSPGVVRPALDGVTIRVNCTNAPSVTTDTHLNVLLLRNVIFSACVNTGAACTDTTTIVRAQVNFEGGTDGATSRTWVQSWSVNQ